MARSATTTLIPLDRYAQVMGLNLAHFNHLNDGKAGSQYWNQTDHDELAQYLASAAAKLRGELGFDIAPCYRSDTALVVPYVENFWSLPEIQTRGYIRALGRRVTAEIDQADVTAVGDTVTLTVTASGDDLDGITADEVQVFYQVADRTDSAATTVPDLAWQVAPLSVTVSGSTITLRGHKAQFVKPSMLEASSEADYNDGDNFVEAVEVYRVYTDTELPLTLHWDACLAAGGEPGADVTQTATAAIVDAAYGLIRVYPATYSDGQHNYISPTYLLDPERVTVEVLAGYPLDTATGRIETTLELAAVRLANVLGPELAHWLNDLAQTRWRLDREGPSDTNPLQEFELVNPFGFTNGARAAWRTVLDKRLIDANWLVV